MDNYPNEPHLIVTIANLREVIDSLIEIENILTPVAGIDEPVESLENRVHAARLAQYKLRQKMTYRMIGLDIASQEDQGYVKRILGHKDNNPTDWS